MKDASAPTWLVVARSVCAAVILTVVCLVLPLNGLGAEPSIRVALDSAAAPVAALLAYLFYGRFRESRSWSDGVMSSFLLLLATSNLVLSAVPRVFDLPATQAADRTALAGVLAGAMFAAGAWLQPRRWRGRLSSGAVVIVGSAGVAALVAQMVGTSLADDAAGLDPADPRLVAMHLAAAGLFLVGAWGCARQPALDRLMALLAGAAILSAVSRLDVVLATSNDDAWSTAGLLLRVGAYLMLVVAGALEIGDYWRRMARTAALEERQRLSRDLHDGIAQDLAFAAGQARILARRSDHPERARLIIAASERALDECRNAIATLTRPIDEPLHVTLSQCAEQVCDRFQTRLDLDLDVRATVTPEVRQSLERIVREAVSNAGRHGQAARVTVRLVQQDGLLLEVEDDGLGFDPAPGGSLQGRYGLLSMQERAEAHGGSFAIQPACSGGTRVVVRLP